MLSRRLTPPVLKLHIARFYTPAKTNIFVLQIAIANINLPLVEHKLWKSCLLIY